MSIELLSDDDVDISELAELMGNLLANSTLMRQENSRAPQVLDARREVERYLDQKQLRGQIADPLFGLSYC